MESIESKGLFWRSLEAFGVQGMQLLVHLVLARILMPADFGVIAILNIFINLANTFVQNGLSSALIQRKNACKEDFSTVFFAENAIALIMYFAIFAVSPAIARFYDISRLTQYLRVFALTIIISSLGSIQTTVLRCKLSFKPSFIANIIGTLFQGLSGIILALNGFGVWSLIVSQIVFRVVTTALLFFFAKWIPKSGFYIKNFKILFSYSWKLAVGWIVGTIYQDVFSFVIGKVYDESTLGFYSKGSTIPNIITRLVTQVTSSVMFPVISKKQDDIATVKKHTRDMISYSSALVFPIMAFLAGSSRPIVLLVLTEKWLPAVPIIQIFCISSGLDVINNANMQSFNAVGRSDIFLFSEVIKRLATIIVVLVLVYINFYYMLLGIALMGFLSLIINSLFNKRLLGYGFFEYIRDLMPSFVLSCILFGFVYVCTILIDNTMICICIQVVLAFSFYLFVAKTHIIQSWTGVLNIVIKLLTKRGKR